MSTILVLLTSPALACLLVVLLTAPAVACNDKGNCPNAPGQNKEGTLGAPLPALGWPIAATGFGVYWLIKRRR